MRMDFATFITEAKTAQQASDQRTHSEHVNHLAFDSHDSVAEAHDALSRLNNYLLGKKGKIPKSITTKVDGAPAVHFLKGQDGRIGIATKGVFNKNPKIAYSHEDVTKLFGHSPDLEAKMHAVLEHGSKILPKDMKPGEMYKGDLLFGGNLKPESRDGHVSFQPNLLRYKYPKGSNEADRVQKAKMGIALHTHYDKKGRASPITDDQREKFQSHPDVFNMDPRVKPNPANFSPDEQIEYNTHMENARREYQKLNPEAYDSVGHHNMNMREYANRVIAGGTGEPLTTEGYINHLNEKHKKDIEKYKTQGTIEKKGQAHAATVDEIMRNKDSFDKMFKMHDHLQKAKNVLIGVMDKNNPSHVELPNGQPTAHEGYMDQNGRKFVNQEVFTKNLVSGGGAIRQAMAAKKGLQESVKMPVNSHHVLIGRFQGVHAGHVQGAYNAKAAADKEGAGFTVLTTHTHDKKNPLDNKQKMYYLQRAMPDLNVEMTSPEHPSIMHYASQAYDRGVRDLTVHAGPDRIDSYNKLLNSYKGVKGPHGFYGNNMNFRFVNMGERQSTEGMKPEQQQMADAALHGDRDTFHQLAGEKLTPEQKDEQMKQMAVQHASGTLMKKAAETGDKKMARAIASPHMSDADVFKMMRDLKAGAAKFAKPKKLKEETVTADVGGLGFNTGNPAVPSNITTTNTSDSDQKNNSLFLHHAKEHATKHNLLKFSSFHVDTNRKPAGKKEK